MDNTSELLRGTATTPSAAHTDPAMLRAADQGAGTAKALAGLEGAGPAMADDLRSQPRAA